MLAHWTFRCRCRWVLIRMAGMCHKLQRRKPAALEGAAAGAAMYAFPCCD